MSDREKSIDAAVRALEESWKALAPSAAPRLIGEHVLKLIAHGDTIAISDLVASLEEDISKGGETAVYSEAAINALRSVRES